MSSHHIVRENQEPALLILSLEGLREDILHQLLEWSPTLFTLAENYEALHSRGIKVDVLLCTGNLSAYRHLEENLVLIPYQQGYWSNLFTYLLKQKNSALTIIGESQIIHHVKPWLNDFSLSIIDRNFKFVIVKQYEKWLPKDAILSLPFKLPGKNLQDIGNSRFKVLEDGFLRIDRQADYFLIGEEL